MSVSQNDIAKAAGVSQRAVSFALNGKPNVSQEKRDEILRVARKLGYRVNTSARAMRKQSTEAIGLLVQHFNVGDSFFMGINKTLQDAGYYTLIEQFTGVLQLDEKPARLVLENVVDGLIIINSDASLVELLHNKFANLINRTVWLESSHFADFGCIQRDEDGVCQQAVKRLAERGFRRLIYIEDIADLDVLPVPFDGSKPYTGGLHYSSHQRRESVQKYAQQIGIEVDAMDAHTRTTRDGIEQLQTLLNQQTQTKTAVVAYDYRMADWCFHQLAIKGLVCPKDYALMALDELRFYKQELHWQELTRLSFNRVKAGEMAAQMVLDMVCHDAQPKSVRIGGDWVQGKTLEQATD